LSRGSSDRQVSQSQPIDGTPVDVPVPRKVSFIEEYSHRVHREKEFILMTSVFSVAMLFLAQDVGAREFLRGLSF